MSPWGTLEAEFKGGRYVTLKSIRQDMPTGSEGVPDNEVYGETGSVWVRTRLRDVRDEEDSFAMLAWFVTKCDYADEAELMWDLDHGPRYRYRYTRAGGLERLRGVLDL